tara:strand:- start:1069 stop:1650 length:582 start_codon:yes stop_codon:yes gene_type:complete
MSRVRANKFVNNAGSGAPDFPFGLTGVGATFSGVVTYEDVSNVDSVGIITAREGIRIGVGGTIGPVGSGIVTYFGDGSQLTGVSVGIETNAQTVTNGNTVLLDLSKDDHKVTATGTVTISCTGGSEGDSHTVRIVNSGTATVGFSTYILFPSGATPVLPTTDGAISLLSLTVHREGTAGIGTQLLGGASLNFS